MLWLVLSVVASGAGMRIHAAKPGSLIGEMLNCSRKET